MASSWGSSRVVFRTHCFLVLAVLGPHCWAWAFRSCLGRASRCRARALGLQRVSGGGTGLSLFPVVLGPSRPGDQTLFPAWIGGFLTTGPPEVSLSHPRLFPSSPLSRAWWGRGCKPGDHAGWFRGDAETVGLPRSEWIHAQGEAAGETHSPAPAPSDPHPAPPGPCWLSSGRPGIRPFLPPLLLYIQAAFALRLEWMKRADRIHTRQGPSPRPALQRAVFRTERVFVPIILAPFQEAFPCIKHLLIYDWIALPISAAFYISFSFLCPICKVLLFWKRLIWLIYTIDQFSSVQSLRHVRLFATPRTAARRPWSQV